VGHSYSGTVTNCYRPCHYGDRSVGGLVGRRGTVTKLLCDRAVSGGEYVGGLVGYRSSGMGRVLLGC